MLEHEVDKFCIKRNVDQFILTFYEKATESCFSSRAITASFLLAKQTVSLFHSHYTSTTVCVGWPGVGLGHF